MGMRDEVDALVSANYCCLVGKHLAEDKSGDVAYVLESIKEGRVAMTPAAQILTRNGFKVGVDSLRRHASHSTQESA